MLKILTLNLWNQDGPWEARAKRIREWIDRLDPDLIGFQEVLRGRGRDQVETLMQGYGFHVDFVKAADFWLDAQLEFGNAIASRFEIIERTTLTLPDAGDAERRAALSVTVQAPHGPVGFACTHLNWKLHHGFARERQVVALARFARDARPETFPPILVGDMNAEPDSAEMRYLRGLQSLGGRSAHFRDAWLESGDGGPGTTWSNRNDYARPWLEPERRIDYVYVGPPLPGGVGRVQSCRVVCDDAEAGVWPSDHFGVYAELQTEPDPALRPLP